MRTLSDIPTSLWQAACDSVHHPMAVVAVDHKFIWANHAYCRMTGYPLAALQDRTWMDITVSQDVEDDLESVKAVLAGKMDRYSMTKRYRHALGHEVPCEIIVWRWPPMGAANEITGFVVEAIPHPASQSEIERLHQACQQRCKTLIKRMEAIERSRDVAKKSHHDSQVVNVGNNSSDTIKLVVGALIVLIGAVAYLSYVASWPHHKGDANPPTKIERVNE